MNKRDLLVLVQRIRVALPNGEEDADKAVDELLDIAFSALDAAKDERRSGFRQAVTAAAAICKKEADGWWALQSSRTTTLLPGFCRAMGDAWTMRSKEILALKVSDER